MKKTRATHGVEGLHHRLMLIGHIAGCHQLPDRSFRFHEKQFPVCARCTGVAIANVLATVSIFFWNPPLWLLLIGCAVMFFDWLIQYQGLLESTNSRRLITGFVGGFSLVSIYLLRIKYLVLFFIQAF